MQNPKEMTFDEIQHEMTTLEKLWEIHPSLRQVIGQRLEQLDEHCQRMPLGERLLQDADVLAELEG